MTGSQGQASRVPTPDCVMSPDAARSVFERVSIRVPYWPHSVSTQALILPQTQHVGLSEANMLASLHPHRIFIEDAVRPS